MSSCVLLIIIVGVAYEIERRTGWLFTDRIFDKAVPPPQQEAGKNEACILRRTAVITRAAGRHGPAGPPDLER